MLHEMGIETGVNLEKLIACARLARDLVGRPLDGHVAKSGPVNHRERG
jgi:hydroxymethylglutaryl-CoA lyase